MVQIDPQSRADRGILVVNIKTREIDITEEAYDRRHSICVPGWSQPPPAAASIPYAIDMAITGRTALPFAVGTEIFLRFFFAKQKIFKI